jgi:hypothetical protein
MLRSMRYSGVQALGYIYWLFLLTPLRVLMKAHLGCFYQPTSKYLEIEFLNTL